MTIPRVSLFKDFPESLLALPQPLFRLRPRSHLGFQLRSPDLNPLLQGSVGFTEFIFRLLSRLGVPPLPQGLS